MKGIRRKFLYISIFSLSLLMSCVSGLDPMPSDIKDLSMSWSVPIGKSDFKIKDGNVNGLPVNYLGLLPIDTIDYSDTVSVDLSEIYKKSSTVNSVSFKINVWNEFPANGFVYLCFTDIDGTIIYRFWDNQPMIIARGSVLFNGDIVSPGYSYNSVTFTKTDIENLQNAKYLVFYARISLWKTSTNSFQYFNKFILTCQVGARMDFTIN